MPPLDSLHTCLNRVSLSNDGCTLTLHLVEQVAENNRERLFQCAVFRVDELRRKQWVLKILVEKDYRLRKLSEASSAALSPRNHLLLESQRRRLLRPLLLQHVLGLRGKCLRLFDLFFGDLLLDRISRLFLLLALLLIWYARPHHKVVQVHAGHLFHRAQRVLDIDFTLRALLRKLRLLRCLCINVDACPRVVSHLTGMALLPDHTARLHAQFVHLREVARLRDDRLALVIGHNAGILSHSTLLRVAYNLESVLLMKRIRIVKLISFQFAVTRFWRLFKCKQVHLIFAILTNIVSSRVFDRAFHSDG